MYEFLLCDLLIRHRDQPELKCYIEQSEGMVRLVEGFASGARRRAHEKAWQAGQVAESRPHRRF